MPTRFSQLSSLCYNVIEEFIQFAMSALELFRSRRTYEESVSPHHPNP